MYTFSHDVEIMFLRHGQSELNVVVDAEDTGSFGYDESTDVDIRNRPDYLHRLTEKGISQADSVGRALAQWKPTTHVYVSPFYRTLETAYQVVSQFPQDINLVLDHRIVERDWGTWGRTDPNTRSSTFPHLDNLLDSDPFFQMVPGGERLSDVATRVDSFLSRVDRETAEGDRVLVVTHHDVMVATRIALEGIDPSSHVAHKTDSTQKIKNCDLIRYVCSSGNVEVSRSSYTDPLNFSNLSSSNASRGQFTLDQIKEILSNPAIAPMRNRVDSLGDFT